MKSSNVLLAADGLTAKLADFGSAMLVGAGRPHTHIRCLPAVRQLLASGQRHLLCVCYIDDLTPILLALGQLGATAEAGSRMQGTLAWAAPELLVGAAADTKVHAHLPCLTGCASPGPARRLRLILSRMLDAINRSGCCSPEAALAAGCVLTYCNPTVAGLPPMLLISSVGPVQ